MSVREPRGFRKAALGGAVALALTGTGVAIAWSANDSPSPAPASTAGPGKSDKAPGQAKAGKDKPDKSQRPQQLHSESVVKKPDGAFETELSQRGTVESVSDTSVTVRSEDGYSRAYTVNAETKIVQVTAPSADGSAATDGGGKRVKPSEGTIADVAAGDVVRISGVKNGDAVTAERIIEGAGDGPGLGQGQGQGLGRGHGNGKGHAK